MTEDHCVTLFILYCDMKLILCCRALNNAPQIVMRYRLLATLSTAHSIKRRHSLCALNVCSIVDQTM